MRISDKKKGLITLAYLIVGLVFLSVGDAYDVNWYAVFFENENVFTTILLFLVWRTIKIKPWKRIFEIAIVWKLFYIAFNIAILFKPFSNYRDFTEDPVICVQILWCIIGFSIFQKLRS